MIAFFLRNWRLSLDIAFVIALCVAFSYFDPFGMFRNTKLQQTANMVSSVKEIGELVTAEYYGEVLSYESDKLNLSSDSISSIAKDFYTDMLYTVDETVQEGKRFDDEEIQKKLKSISNGQVYDYLIAFISAKYLGKSLDKFYDKETKKLKGRAEKKLFKEVYQDLLKNHKSYSEEKYLASLDFLPEYLNDFGSFYHKITNVQSTSDDSEVVMIARGTVKAGFKFNKLNEDNFQYNSATKQVLLYGIEPIILDTIINPWFIPQLKVKGFEFVNNPSKRNYDDVVKVKKSCYDSLAAQAINANIIYQAKINGIKVLQNLFSIVLDEPDIQVVFNEFPEQKFVEKVSMDGTISLKEALQIDSVFNLYKSRLDYVNSEEKVNLEFEQRILINNLKKNTFLGTHKYYTTHASAKPPLFSRYSLELAKMAQSTLEKTSCDNIEDILRPIRDTLQIKHLKYNVTYSCSFVEENSVWFSDTSFIGEFNTFLSLLSKIDSVEYECLKTYEYPVLDCPLSKFDDFSLHQTDTVKYFIDSMIENVQFSIPQEKEVLRKVETENAIRYIQSKPIKQFNRFVSEMFN